MAQDERWLAKYNDVVKEVRCMDQETRWITKYEEVKSFIQENKRNPSKYDDAERNMYNFLKHTRKLLNAGLLKSEREKRVQEVAGTNGAI